MAGRGFLISGTFSGLIAIVMPHPSGLHYKHETYRTGYRAHVLASSQALQLFESCARSATLNRHGTVKVSVTVRYERLA